MPTSYTSLLGFALPATGELSGTWGTTVNNSITELVEDAIAATATASVAGGDWTLSTTGSGAANEARCAILIPTGSPGVSRNIIAPSQSKAYVVINQSNAAVVLKGAATTGATLVAGEKAVVAWNGSDFVTVASSVFSGTVPVASGGTGQTTYTNGQLLIGNTTGNTLTKATLTAGSGVTITNGTGSITIAATGSGGTVTNVGTSNGPAPINGLTLTGGPITGSGTVTLGGGVNVSTITTGILPVANGGTGVNAAGTSGNVLTSNGTAWVSQAGAVASNIQTFSATGTYTKPTGAKFVMVEIWGAGGGGSGGSQPNVGGTGGGGGAYVTRTYAAPEVGATETVTIGAGGPGGGSSSPGTDGGISNFGSLLFAGGGTSGLMPGGGGTGGLIGGVTPSSPLDPFLKQTTVPSPVGSLSLAFNLTGGIRATYPTNDSGIYGINWSVWGGGVGGPQHGGGTSTEAPRGAHSLFGGGGGGRGGGSPVSGAPSGLGRLFGRYNPSSIPNGTAGGGPGVAGTAGSGFDGGGGGGLNAVGGKGGTAGGGGGGGGSPSGSAATGGAGGNGYAVVYTW